jgi:hypothetical protein
MHNHYGIATNMGTDAILMPVQEMFSTDFSLVKLLKIINSILSQKIKI